LFSSLFTRLRRKDPDLDKLIRFGAPLLEEIEPLVYQVKMKTRGKDRRRSIDSICLMAGGEFHDLSFPIALKLAMASDGRMLADQLHHLHDITKDKFGLNGALFVDFVLDKVPGCKTDAVLESLGRMAQNKNFSRWMFVSLSSGFADAMAYFDKPGSPDCREYVGYPLHSINSLLSNRSFINEWFIEENISRIAVISMAIGSSSSEQEAEIPFIQFSRILSSDSFDVRYLAFMEKCILENRSKERISRFFENLARVSPKLFQIKVGGRQPE
jgi:hypothetical protein